MSSKINVWWKFLKTKLSIYDLSWFFDFILRGLWIVRSAMSYRGVSEGRVYVGNLPPDIRNRDIEDLFYKYGKIVFIDLKNRNGPPFAFVEFEDPR